MATKAEQAAFIGKIAPLIVKYAAERGYKCVSAAIAQACLESGYGLSKLAAGYHNYFGLKCGGSWKGASVNMQTMEEYTPGTLTPISDFFRAFSDMEQGVKGYFDFLEYPRYKAVRKQETPEEYLTAIKAAGYATSSAYVANNMNVVRAHNLTEWDKKLTGNQEQKGEGHPMYSRQKVVDLAESWIGKKESDGSYKTIIDTYNTLPAAQLPRKTKMLYGWAWCACMWSALAVKLKYLSIMPIEISCYYLIEAAKRMGVWQENDDYIPEPGDAILYDWDDTGAGDNTGNPDHVGTVTYVNRDSGYMVVTEGNYGNAVKKRTISLNGRYIRGFITPKYDDGAVAEPERTGGKSVSEIAHEAIAGQWGNGAERKRNMEAAGYDYDVVQAEINRIVNGGAAKADNDNSVDQTQPIARKVISSCYASHVDKAIAGTYITTADLYCRNDAGKNKKALCLIPKGTEVQCYGYYSVYGGVKWLYIQFTMDGTQYTGFSSGEFLKKTS